jgi:hypothetical protein
MRTYLEKAKSLNTKTLPSMRKNNKSVRSVLECIDEEDTNEEKVFSDNSVYTADPRYLLNGNFFSSLKKDKKKSGRISYSILAPKVTTEDLFRLTKGRGSYNHPKQKYLSMNSVHSRTQNRKFI